MIGSPVFGTGAALGAKSTWLNGVSDGAKKRGEAFERCPWVVALTRLLVFKENAPELRIDGQELGHALEVLGPEFGIVGIALFDRIGPLGEFFDERSNWHHIDRHV